MNFDNCCYTLQRICIRQDVHKVPLIWRSVCPRMEMHLELGKTMGRLCFMISLSGDLCQRLDYFFSNTENDLILKRMAPVAYSKDNICIFLPNGDLGLFSLNRDMDAEWWYANDSYVLNVAALDNEYNSNEFTLGLFFDTLYRHIRLRTAWKNLYFRCFRRSFHPQQSQGQTLIAQWSNNILSESTTFSESNGESNGESSGESSASLECLKLV